MEDDGAVVDKSLSLEHCKEGRWDTRKAESHIKLVDLIREWVLIKEHLMRTSAMARPLCGLTSHAMMCGSSLMAENFVVP